MTTTTGATPKRLTPAETQCKLELKPKSYSIHRCRGKYSFISNGIGKGENISFADAWKGFEESFTSARIPCESIKRYPVVARWRNDVDFVAAGIFCF